MTMSTPDADNASSSEIPPTIVVPTTKGGLNVTVRFDRASVWRSGLVLMGLVAGLLLLLWLVVLLWWRLLLRHEAHRLCAVVNLLLLLLLWRLRWQWLLLIVQRSRRVGSLSRLYVILLWL